MTMNKLAHVLCMLALSAGAVAQQQSFFGLSHLNLAGLNPAAAALDQKVQLGVQYRQQWLGFSKAPATGQFNFSIPLPKNLAIGMNYRNDRIGVSMFNQISATIAYRWWLKEKQGIYMSFGLEAGAVYYSNGLEKVATAQSDVSFLEAADRRWLPQAGVGLLIKGQRFFASVSVPQLLSPTLTGKQEVFATGSNPGRVYQEVVMAGAYDFDLKGKATLGPAMTFRYTPLHAPVSFDVWLRATIINRVRVGAGYRYQDAYLFYAGGEIVKGLWLNYGYEYPMNISQGYQTGTHEAGITYAFSLPERKKKERSTPETLPVKE